MCGVCSHMGVKPGSLGKPKGTVGKQRKCEFGEQLAYIID